MKKVLIIANDFPPLNSIGAQRPYSWYKYFIENELYPIVFAKNWGSDNSDSIEINKSGEIHLIKCEMEFRNNVSKIPFLGIWIRKSFTFLEYILKWKTIKIDHTKSLYWSAQKYLKSNHADIIIATGEPWILFKYANSLSKEFEIPWIADYRDGWNTNVKLEYNRFEQILSKIYFKKIEKKIISTACMLSFSDPCESLKISKITTEKKIITPFNGYDNDLINNLKDLPASEDILTIAYAGTIYDFQDLESFLLGLNEFIKNNGTKKIKVNFFGSKNNQLTIDRINQINPDLFDYIKLTPKIPQKEVIDLLKSSHVLLLLADKKHVALPAKVFEYIGLERTILVSTNDKSDVERFVKETKAGIICDNSKEIYNALVLLFDKFQKNSNFKVKIKEKETYSRQQQARILSDFIKKALQNF